VYDPLFKYGQNFYLALTEEAKERILNVSPMCNYLTASELASSQASSGYMLLLPAASGEQYHQRTDDNSYKHFVMFGLPPLYKGERK